MNTVIRPAAINDIAQLTSLSIQLGYERTEKETFAFLNAILLSETEAVYIAEQENSIVGWIQLSYMVRLESGYFCEVTGLVVDDMHRSQQVGHQLIAFAKEWCWSKNCSKLRVGTNVTRLRTHAFYQKEGFTLIKEQKVYEISPS